MSKTTKSVRQIDNLSTSYQDKINLNSTIGLNGSHMPEAVPKYDRADSEVIFQNKNNARIVLGRDRPGNKLSGYGGAGYTNCGSIDLVCGAAAGTAVGPEPDKFSNPDMFTDAARMYISQKTDVDKNFEIAKGKAGSPEGVSTVAAKADTVRLIGRMGIKIVTGTDETDSNNTPIDAAYGIDLIAGNFTDKYKPLGFPEEIESLQPIPKGDNLVKYLKELSSQVDQLSNFLSQFIEIQQTFNKAVGKHTHTFTGLLAGVPGLTGQPFFTLPATNTSLNMATANFVKSPNSNNRMNISTLNKNFLDSDGPLYINSRHVRTT